MEEVDNTFNSLTRIYPLEDEDQEYVHDNMKALRNFYYHLCGTRDKHSLSSSKFETLFKH